ncbi:MAG: LEA type 2 family protein [Crocinitomicaceae bacterium]|jgi:LEA14-like dessication related protein
MKSVIAVIVAFFIFSSCSFYELEYKGGEQIKFGKLEGKQFSFTAGGKILNQNGFAIKVKPSDLSLFIEGEYIGLVHLDKEIRMKRKSDEYIEGRFTATLADGAMLRALFFINKKQLEICLKGKVKVGVWMFGKKFDVNETRTIRGSDLKFI